MSSVPRELARARSHLGDDTALGPPLGGGVTSRVRRLEGGWVPAVLKQVTNLDWLADGPDVIGYEARIRPHRAATACSKGSSVTC